ncbi:hypothetical protein F4804DRAFT_120985 [Jackrogersella minutella]|nr:hypothetical protein F4804DRAFT_120985 [Jackrogersella minutella]
MGKPIPPSPTPSEYAANVARLERRIASYQNRVRRTSVQLLVTAAAGYQYRETNLATRQGWLIEGIDPGAPRKHRAFDVRSLSSLSSTEAVARALKTWINNNHHKTGVQQGMDIFSDTAYSHQGHQEGDEEELDGSVVDIGLEVNADDDADPNEGDDGNGYESSEDPLAGAAVAMMARASAMPGPGDWADKIVAPLIERYIGDFSLGKEAQASRPASQKSSKPSHRPSSPDRNIYDPTRWGRLLDTNDASWLKDSAGTKEFKNRPDDTPIGLMTWKEEEKAYPSLGSLLEMREKPTEELWDPDRRFFRERNLANSERPPLEADVDTKLALERRTNYERREMNPLYNDYSRVPQVLPEKVSDEEMRRGPQPDPPPLELVSEHGEKVEFSRPTPRFRQVAEPKRKRDFEAMIAKEPLPVAQYHYPIDSPAVATFRFSDGRQVSDIMRPGPLDERNQVRGSEDLVKHGQEVEKQQEPFKKPYTYEGMPPPPPSDSKPPGLNRKISPAQRARIIAAKKKSVEELRREAAARKAQDPFWHYSAMSDRESVLHKNGQPGPNKRRKGGSSGGGGGGGAGLDNQPQRTAQEASAPVTSNQPQHLQPEPQPLYPSLPTVIEAPKTPNVQQQQPPPLYPILPDPDDGVKKPDEPTDAEIAASYVQLTPSSENTSVFPAFNPTAFELDDSYVQLISPIENDGVKQTPNATEEEIAASYVQLTPRENTSIFPALEPTASELADSFVNPAPGVLNDSGNSADNPIQL